MTKYRLVKEAGRLWCEAKYFFMPTWLRFDLPFESVEEYQKWIDRKKDGYYKPVVVREDQVP